MRPAKPEQGGCPVSWDTKIPSALSWSHGSLFLEDLGGGVGEGRLGSCELGLGECHHLPGEGQHELGAALTELPEGYPPAGPIHQPPPQLRWLESAEACSGFGTLYGTFGHHTGCTCPAKGSQRAGGRLGRCSPSGGLLGGGAVALESGLRR